MTLLPIEDLNDLRGNLLFLHVEELKELNRKFDLSERGKKIDLILRIIHFLQTGQKLVIPKFPAGSYAKRGVIYPLSLDSLMLKGAYKNDFKTRLFFKKVIGAHFHFTAFGVDWLNEQWTKGKPPTYKEFADMWSAETLRRKSLPAAPKEEWAFINFVQNYLRKSRGANKLEVHQAWESERQRRKGEVMEMLGGILTK